MERLAIKANYRTRSLGVAFDGCTLPGAEEPLFHVPAGKMSLGLGIHGEPGISEHPMPTASELAELLVSKLLADKPDDAGTEWWRSSTAWARSSTTSCSCCSARSRSC